MNDDLKKSETEEKEPELLTHEFEIDGKSYIYNIDQLSAERILTAVSLFQLHQKMKMTNPATVDELKMIINRKTEIYALATLLVEVEKDENGKIIKYIDEFDTFQFDTIKLLSQMKSRAELTRLMECKNDFFFHTGLVPEESLQQLLDLTKQLSSEKEKKLLASFLQNQIQKIESVNSTQKSAKKSASTTPQSTKAK